MAKAPPPLERATQRTIIRWLRVVLPAGSIVAAIVNEQRGAGATALQRMRYGQARKASGVQTGFFDCTALIPGGRVIWFEFKRDGVGVVSEAQQMLHAQARALGHAVIVCTSIETARGALLDLGYTLREATGQPVADVKVRLAKVKVRIVGDAIPW